MTVKMRTMSLVFVFGMLPLDPHRLLYIHNV